MSSKIIVVDVYKPYLHYDTLRDLDGYVLDNGGDVWFSLPEIFSILSLEYSYEDFLLGLDLYDYYDYRLMDLGKGSMYYVTVYSLNLIMESYYDSDFLLNDYYFMKGFSFRSYNIGVVLDSYKSVSGLSDFDIISKLRLSESDYYNLVSGFRYLSVSESEVLGKLVNLSSSDLLLLSVECYYSRLWLERYLVSDSVSRYKMVLLDTIRKR